jgi:Zn-dependent peptidase ImmA (M78 family)
MAFILTSIIQKKEPRWNREIYLYDEMPAFCKRHRARYFEDETLKIRGEYTIYKNQPFIIVKKKLGCEMKAWIALHEGGHHLLHAPTPHKFSTSLLNRMDREANFFAALALIPTWLYMSKTPGEIVEEYNYPWELMKIRAAIWEAYQI